ncbi:hypothetical protein Taro_027646 [Colocasia esculenta]|uniref:Phosphotransferase n=1 Tax=Colocasia esculenta TaxID=4460 RepID=A0A843VS27_COLES|nr:hypothetical protein [Colocasia esculenta]
MAWESIHSKVQVNDTVATLVGARYWDDDVMVAVILGTGTNACYTEHTYVIPKLQGPKPSSGRMIINTEWGAFSNSLPLTEYDRDMDSATINLGEQVVGELASSDADGDDLETHLVDD